MEPVRGFEPLTCGLRNRCSTTELHRPWGECCVEPSNSGGLAAGASTRMLTKRIRILPQPTL